MTQSGESDRTTSIRADVRAMRADGSLGPKVGEVVVTPGDLVLAIHTRAGTVFRAPLGQLAWLLALMEPTLASYLVEPGDDDDE